MSSSVPPAAVKSLAPPVCPRCGATFTCGMLAGEPVCWCAALPPLASVPQQGAGCYCPACLKALLGAGQSA